MARFEHSSRTDMEPNVDLHARTSLNANSDAAHQVRSESGAAREVLGIRDLSADADWIEADVNAPMEAPLPESTESPGAHLLAIALPIVLLLLSAIALYVINHMRPI